MKADNIMGPGEVQAFIGPLRDLGLLCRFIERAPALENQAAKAAVQDAFADTLAVALAGACEPSVAAVRGMLGQPMSGGCLALDGRADLPAPQAALINGTAAHSLDFDDNFDPAKAHASAVLVPALWALGEAIGATEGAVARAYAAGLQVLAALGASANPSHRQHGWHATGTLGTMGAAAACAVLLGLDWCKARHALSLSTSMMGGFMAQFGTDAKALHAGLAAQGGVMAALLAREGMTADPHVWNGPYSVRTLMAGEGRAIIDPNDLPLALLQPGLKMKRFANCASAHRSMDAFEAIINRIDLLPDAIDRIAVTLPAAHGRNLMHPRPKSKEQARFSLPFALALLAVRRRFTLRDLELAEVSDPQIERIMSVVQIYAVEIDETRQPTIVEVDLTDGTSLQEVVWHPIGSAQRPLNADQKTGKILDCLNHAGQPNSEEFLSYFKAFGGQRPLAHFRQTVMG